MRLAENIISTNDLNALKGSIQPLDAVGNTTIQEYLGVLGIGLMQLAVYLFLISLLVAGVIWLFSLGKTETLDKAKKTLVYSSIGFVVTFGSYSLLSFLFKNALPKIFTSSIAQTTGSIYQIVLGVSASGFLVLLLFSGIRWMFGLGSEEAVENAKNQLRASIIGLVLVMGAFAIGKLLLKYFNVV